MPTCSYQLLTLCFVMMTNSTTAKREGDFFIVNGVKKWITGGATSDYFTTVVRTGGEGVS
jgi:alkylation response protein AidB-like acyl-CoA dehydrogenase